jgi:ribosome biogenesis GTPase / thiamine phosphate phosphatase
LRGLVTKSTGNRYHVLFPNGSQMICTFKGKFKISGIRSTNPIAVGDYVRIREEIEGQTALITSIEDRKNYIIRRASNLSKETHIIAANLDLAFLVISLARPSTPSGFIDRFLASAEAYRIPVVILINKVDDYTKEEMKELNELRTIYSSIGYEVLAMSAFREEDILLLREMTREKVCLFAGNSGVGKSTLTNGLEPGLDLKTAEISSFHSKGKHTTTFAQMFPLSNGGYIIDTPGIKGFGVFDFDPYEISHFFPEIFRLGKQCKFGNCLHLEEPGCAIRKGLEKGQISESRYASYLSILQDENEKYRKPY